MQARLEIGEDTMRLIPQLPRSVVVLLVLIIGLPGCQRSGPQVNISDKASCGSNDLPEGEIQGQVPREDRLSGRSKLGYRCNLELVGQYQGEGASWVDPSSGHCAYMATSFLGIPTKQSQGVQVVDVSDPTHPKLSTTLISPAMLIGPWESLKVNETRQLLGAVAGGPIVAAGFFDVYDISQDCTKPVQLNGIAGTPLELPADVLGHEGNWTPDGKTYWSTGLIGGSVTAIDVSNPASPQIIYTGIASFPVNHGAEFSDDGNRMYLSTIFPAGVLIFDVSDIQSRKPSPSIRQIGSLTWNAQGAGQHAFRVRYGNMPYLIAADEFASEGVRIIDISDETKPREVTHIQLEIQLPKNQALRDLDTAGNGLFGYDAHYCNVDSRINPTALACGFFQSGVRVFDIRNPGAPREIAYFNPPAQADARARLGGSEHAGGIGLAPTLLPTTESVSDYVFNIGQFSDANLSADWCSSPPRFVGEQLWVTCQDNGFMVLRFSNGAYPLR